MPDPKEKSKLSAKTIEQFKPDLSKKMNFEAEKDLLDVLSNKFTKDDKEKELAIKYKLDPTYIPDLMPQKPRSQQRPRTDTVKITALSLNKKGEMQIVPVDTKKKNKLSREKEENV